MSKRLDVIQATRRGHLCCAPGCGKLIPGRSAALALIEEEQINGQKQRFVAYFCNIDCYNNYECQLIYAGGASCDDPGEQSY